jgi:hypothetical protein
VVPALVDLAAEVNMATFKYLMVVAAVLAAAFFLAQPETKLPTNSYAEVVPDAISALAIPLLQGQGDRRYQVDKAADDVFVSVRNF